MYTFLEMESRRSWIILSSFPSESIVSYPASCSESMSATEKAKFNFLDLRSSFLQQSLTCPSL